MEWIKLKDELPPYTQTRWGNRSYKDVLCFDGQSVFQGYMEDPRYGDSIYFRRYDEMEDTYYNEMIPSTVGNVTHWMPLPKPPTE